MVTCIVYCVFYIMELYKLRTEVDKMKRRGEVFFWQHNKNEEGVLLWCVAVIKREERRRRRKNILLFSSVFLSFIILPSIT